MTTLTMTLTNAKHRQVVIRLAGVTPGVVPVDDSNNVLADSWTVRTNASGVASISLVANTDITPANTYYTITVDQTSPTAIYHVRIPDTTTVDLSDDAIQIVVPEPPRVLPVASSGNAFDVVRVKADESGYELAAPGSAASPVLARFIVAANAVNGTGTSFALLSYDPTASASGIVPAGWSTLGTVNAATVTAFLEANYPDGAKAFYPATSKVYDLHPDTLTDPWVEVDADVVVVNDTLGVDDLVAVIHGSTHTVLDAELIANPGGALGLLMDTTKNLGPQIRALEGVVDRPRFVSAVATSNVNLAALGSATFEYGTLRFDAETETNMWLMGQTTPAQNGHYKVASDYSYTKIANPSTFDPPGQGAPLWLVNPGDPHHGAEWRWFDEDPTVNVRAVGDQTGAVGAWVLQHDPTDSGGVALGETSTTAYRGDRGKTAYDHSQVTTGNPHGTTAADLGATPTSRTFAGLDLTSNRTVAEVYAAMGMFGPWRAITGLYTHTHVRTGAGAHTASRCFYLPVMLTKQVTVDRIAVFHEATVTTSGGYRVGLYAANSDGLPSTRLVDGGVIDLSGAAGSLKTVTVSQTVGPGLFYVAAALQHTGSSPSVSVGNPVHLAPSIDNTSNGFFFEASVSGALPSTATPSTSTSSQAPIVSIRTA